MNKIFKLIGKRGRTTVPFEIRMKMRLGYNSLVSYELKDEDTLILRKEKIESFFSKDDNLITLHQRKRIFVKSRYIMRSKWCFAFAKNQRKQNSLQFLNEL